MHTLVTSARTASPEGVVGPRARLRALVGAGILALAGLVGMAVPAAAGPLVDPDTLQPPPPPGTECRLDGQWIICQTSLNFTPVNEPILDIALPCGTMYWTGTDARSGIRWYNADDRKLVKRFISWQTDSVVSLSPTGAGPTAALTQHYNWWIYYAVPGDESSGSLQERGTSLTISAPGYGVIVHIAGQFVPDDETFHGTVRFPDDPEVAAELCAALTG
jgi:hypothetical protein